MFLNGKPVFRQEIMDYQRFVFCVPQPHMANLLVPGKNTLAVHCTNNDVPGWGYVDVGLYAASEASLALTKRRFAAADGDPWTKLAVAYQLKGDQKAIDQLVERRPKLAGPIGDLFTLGEDEDQDWRRAIALYSKGITVETTDVLLLSKVGLAPMSRSRIGMPPRPTGRGP